MNFCHYIYCNGRERWFLKGYSNCEPQFAWTLKPDEAIRFYRLLEATAVMQVIVHKTSANIKLLGDFYQRNYPRVKWFQSFQLVRKQKLGPLF